MDITAFNELIALARETAASLAQAEQKVAAFKEELAEQTKDAQANAAVAPVRSASMRVPIGARKDEGKDRKDTRAQNGKNTAEIRQHQQSLLFARPFQCLITVPHETGESPARLQIVGA